MLMIGQRKEGDSRAGCLYGKEISPDSGKEHSAQGAGTTALKINKPWEKAGGCMADPLDKTLSAESAGEAIVATPCKL